MGIVALVTLLLSITSIILWPGWRKLIAGFMHQMEERAS